MIDFTENIVRKKPVPKILLKGISKNLMQYSPKYDIIYL
jgi:hypothetical protein